MNHKSLLAASAAVTTLLALSSGAQAADCFLRGDRTVSTTVHRTDRLFQRTGDAVVRTGDRVMRAGDRMFVRTGDTVTRTGDRMFGWLNRRTRT
jgi:hypothetical protein